MNTVPNLDGLAIEELEAFHAKYSSATLHEAADLVGDTRRGYTIATQLLATYAQTKALAMRARELGNIVGALAHEFTCENIYNLLPEDLRW